MNYLVIDLEMCMVSKEVRSSQFDYPSEVIQIGAALLDHRYQLLDTMTQYVKPEYGQLDEYIIELTGIQDEVLRGKPSIEEALISMLDWIGERNYIVYTWSGTDLRQLKFEIKKKEIKDTRIKDFIRNHKWVDYQKKFTRLSNSPREVGLEKALSICDIKPDGKFHDGLSDAVNTAMLIGKMEYRKKVNKSLLQ